jgi:23S rRNA (uracil1939-C5)-methyltransferase
MTRRPNGGRGGRAGRGKGTASSGGRGRSAPGRLPESAGVVTIDAVAAGGDGVGRLDGLVLFVPRTAPGDVVQVAYTARARHARGRVLQIITPSPLRVEPPCPHYVNDRCGGCQLQHLSADAQREARRQIVRDTLQRIGRRTVSLPELVSDAQFGYRRRLTLALHRRGAGWVGGLHAHDDPARVFALETCLIAEPALVEAWQALRMLVRRDAPALPPVDRLRLSLRLDHEPSGSTGERRVAVVVEGGTAWPEREAWAAAARNASALIGGVHWQPARPVGMDRGVAVVDAAGDNAPAAEEALAFAQVNARVAESLRTAVFDAVVDFGAPRVIDAYAGTGELALRLATRGLHVVAIEADPAGAEMAVSRLREAGDEVAGRVRVVCDLVERALPASDGARAQPQVLVVNPPRAGVDAQVTSWLESEAAQSVRGVVYVSCDPATLARDLARLPSWEIRTVQGFDMFPQTAHVETVCVLQRGNA